MAMYNMYLLYRSVMVGLLRLVQWWMTFFTKT